MQALIAKALLRQQNVLITKATQHAIRYKSNRTSLTGTGGGKGRGRDNNKPQTEDANRKLTDDSNENESKSALSFTAPSGSSSASKAAENPLAQAGSIEGQAKKAKEDVEATPTPPPPIRPFSLDFSPPELEQQADEGTGKSSVPPSESSTTGSTSSAKPNANAGLPGLAEAAAADASSQAQRTGARSSKGSLSSIERKRRNALRTFFLLGGVAIGGLVVYMGRPWEDTDFTKHARLDKDAGRLTRTLHRFKQFTGIFTEPIWEELLPQQIPGEERPYTLILSVDDLLVSSIWDRQHGWRTAKRPGVDYFLNYLSQWFEIVIFTTNQYYLTDQIIEKLDPLRSVIAYRLYRESTRYHDGHVVKDLSHLNRDLSKVIAIDTNAEHYSLQPENAIIVPPWKGDANDNGLVGLIPFLESIGIYAPQDVRPILSAYHGKDIITEYAKVEAEQKKRHVEDWLRSGNAKKQTSGPSWFGRLFGGSSSSTQTLPKPPLTFLERKRLEAQYHYMLDERHKKANEESILAYFKAMDEANMKAMGAGSLMGFIKSWGQPPPVPEAAPPPKIVYLPPLPPPPELVNAGYFGERGLPGKR